MILADIGRAAAIGAVPLAFLADALSMNLLFVVAFVTGSISVVFMLAWMTMFASVARREQYVEANALLNGSRSVSAVGGPAIGGVLIQLLGAPIALAADAISFLASALFLSRIRTPDSTVERDPGLDTEVPRGEEDEEALEGEVEEIHRGHGEDARPDDRVAEDERHPRRELLADRPGHPGDRARRGRDRRRHRRGHRTSCRAQARHRPRLPAVDGPLSGLGDPDPARRRAAVSGDPRHPVRRRVHRWPGRDDPRHQRWIDAPGAHTRSNPGRAGGAFTFVNVGVRPIGAILGGVLGATIGVRETLLIVTVAQLSGLLWLVGSPVLRLKDLPESSEDEGAPDEAANPPD